MRLKAKEVIKQQFHVSATTETVMPKQNVEMGVQVRRERERKAERERGREREREREKGLH